MRAIACVTHRLLTGLVVVGAVIAGAALPAAAHPTDGAQTDAEHAAADLVGVPMSQIEADTRANAERFTHATGVVPGRRTAATTRNRIERAASRAAADPETGGEWSDEPIDTPVVPVFQAMLPTGKVLMWDSVGDGATESYPDQTFTRATVWDPATNTSKDVKLLGYNIFCAGYTQLADGNVLVAGGNKDQQLNGIVQTHIFDWRTETWSRGPDMAAGRWYPSVAPLANGEAYISGGGPTTAEVYQTNNTLRALTGFVDPSERWYPFLITRPDGRVQWAGPKNSIRTVDPRGLGSATAWTGRDGRTRDYGSFATYDIGKTLIAGGDQKVQQDGSKLPTNTAIVLNTNATATVTTTGNMASARRQFDLTILADGSVLASGGMSEISPGGSDQVDLNHPVFAAERWNPSTGAWTTLAPAQRVRQYHSSALLLPDGRVLTGGGGVCGTCVAKMYLEKNIEYFSPPYLFRTGGGAAVRPQITSPVTATTTTTTTVNLNTAFTIGSPQAGSIKKVGLIRLGAPTHGDDQGQRYVPLKFTVSGTTISATAPANGAIAPPGYYQLVITDSSGVPSEAVIIKVAQGSTPAATAMRGGDGSKCVDIDGGTTTNRSRLQLYTCNSTPAQLWAPGAKGSLRALGKCIDIDQGKIVVGGRVQIYTCNGGNSQNWTRGPDGTIQPTVTPGLCLGPIGNATANYTKLELQTCDGRATQNWRWTVS